MTYPIGNDTTVWIDGVFVPANEAMVSVFDHGLTVGDGVFETMKVTSHGVFALARHLRRLHRSLERMGLSIRATDAELREVIDVLVGRNGGANGAAGRVRITVTGGDAPLGSGRGTHGSRTVIATGAAAPWAPTSQVTVVPWTRNERAASAGIKSTSYADNVLALRFAQAAGSDEAIFANTKDELCEGTGSNIFIVREGVVATPPLSSGCLDGITRALVVEALAQAGIDVDQSPLPLDALRTCDEAFLTSSTRDVHPIAAVDGVALPTTRGELTLHAMAAFAAFDPEL